MTHVAVEVLHTAAGRREGAAARRARRPDRRARSGCHPSGSTTPAAASSSRTSPALEEYYPTRAEREILDRHAADIAAPHRRHTLVELGSGSSEKTRLLLDALRAGGTLRQFVPLDVSETALREAVAAIAAATIPALRVHGVVGDFTEHLGRIRRASSAASWPSSAARSATSSRPSGPRSSARSARSLAPGEWLLLGTDLVKDPDVLVRAYDDAAGVTAEFNRNVLRVLNRELGADFPLDGLRPRRALGRRARVDRDASARQASAHRHGRRPRPARAARSGARRSVRRSRRSSAEKASRRSWPPPDSRWRSGGPMTNGVLPSRWRTQSEPPALPTDAARRGPMKQCASGNAKEPHPGSGVGLFGECLSGGVLLSHTVPSAVPSALKGLASGFGMGPGVSPSL